MTWKRSHRTLFAELVLYLLNVQRIWPNIRLFQFSMLLQNHDTSYEYLRFPSHVYFLCIEGKYSIKFIVGSRFKKKTKKYHYTFCVWSNLIHNLTENLKTNYHKSLRMWKGVHKNTKAHRHENMYHLFILPQNKPKYLYSDNIWNEDKRVLEPALAILQI